jgi:hypothetical protein
LTTCHLHFLSQLPYEVTVFPADYFTELLPVEFCGWWLQRVGVRNGDWVMVIGADIQASVAVHLLARCGLGINVVNGVDTLSSSAVCSVSDINTLLGICLHGTSIKR